MRGFVAALSLASAASAAPSFFGIETIHGDAAPILSSTGAEDIPNSYIIRFKNHVTDASASEHHSWVQQIHSTSEDERLELRKRGGFVEEAFRGLGHTFKIGESFHGYAGHFDESTIEAVRNHPDVSQSPYPTSQTALNAFEQKLTSLTTTGRVH